MTENVESLDVSFTDLRETTDSQITELKLKHGISASAKFLRDVSVCLSVEKIAPTEEILRFFDAIYLSATSRLENVDISAIFLCEGEGQRTLRDLIVKYSYLNDTDTEKLPLDELLHISSKYLSTIDVCPPTTVCVTDSEGDLSFTDESGSNMISLEIDSSPLPFGYQKSNNRANASTPQAQKGDVFFLLEPHDSSNGYNALLRENLFTDAVKTSTIIDRGGILYALSHLTVGATVFGDAAGASDNLSNLIVLHEGKMLVSTSRENEEILKSFFEEHSICALKVAEASDVLSFSIITGERNINIRANFLRGLFKYRTIASEQIPLGSFGQPSYDKLYIEKEGTREEASGAVSFKGHLISALKTKDVSFASAINIVLDSIFALLSRGVSIKDIGITLKIGCNKESLGGAVSAILGAYRVCLELAVAQKDSSFVETDDGYILCCAYAKEEKRKTPTLSPDEPSLAYLLSFGRFNDTTPSLMPDFSSVRKTCILLEDVFSNGRAVNARTINGPVVEEAKKLCDEHFSLFPYLNDGINDDTRAQGVILQAPMKEKIKSPLIGVIRKG